MDVFPELKKIQEIELEILVKFDEICRSNDLKYCLDSGTLLGAVRHGGFIPWDDDIDVSMPRADYDKFMAIGQDCLGSDFFLQNRKTDPKAPFTFSKIRKNGTTFMEWNKRNIKMHQGIFIDIFPFDVLPEEEEGRKEYIDKCYNLNRRLINRMIPDRAQVPEKSLKWLIGAVARRIKYYFLHFIPISRIDNEIDKEFSKYKDRGIEGRDLISHSYYMKDVFSSDIFTPPQEMTFEGHKFYVPADYDRYLKLVYGDYMQLPPIEDRVGHRPKYVSLDKELFQRYV